MSAQQDRFDREMLRSMAASFSSGLAFSFNSQDMAELMQRMSERVEPSPRADIPAARIAELKAAIGTALLVMEPDANEHARDVLRAALDKGEG